MSTTQVRTERRSPFDLHGSCAVVTGAGRGLGQAVALGLARAGADLVLLGRPGNQSATCEQIVELGGEVEVVDLDVSDLDAVERVGSQLAAQRQVDVLVNNAGIIDRQDSVAVDAKAWSRVLDVNLTGLFFLTQQLGRPMVDRGRGKIVNIASLLSFQGGLRVASYAASKHGVAGITKALANEWAPHGVQVNAIAPGYIATDNTQPLRDDPDRSRSILERIPAGRWGTVDDIAGAAVFLSSSASDYVNGHVLVVDGGWMAR
ncbi:2-dehydro-3-deoxy-D-gluconate 5-dehydrogenase KduD [Nocardioides bizhenqiangii]|uniref:2-dehydro-3-deoxy-D-gluconate 5-dehydrogenase KduD n=1 Tax=Nocardioides bizhenqiangii TaxID=3095076 RepID=A0ABZ0ZLX4_9ACTN|nr:MULTISPECIES: 2-dehydro-3-deoxy-D-gluconate 5-dehydrogenase KduD [unclassified Nocardioides]MDZ5620989.1 2-dehydro-3-deoxy-D-gluconate 5-dehydrogenase KduD [Nocardioides sp. HM23]WQQ25346.1 2-dehydro-3-deoxy-D-gluconate 5-dehydrogenase KduD [Nocardioides sp. HM61]